MVCVLSQLPSGSMWCTCCYGRKISWSHMSQRSRMN
jgi:hypothetical protein